MKAPDEERRENAYLEIIIHVGEKCIGHRIDRVSHAADAVVHNFLIWILEEAQKHRNQLVEGIIHIGGIEFVYVVFRDFA